jgi:hypothetical protein
VHEYKKNSYTFRSRLYENLKLEEPGKSEQYKEKSK